MSAQATAEKRDPLDIQRGLVQAGIPESQVDTSQVGRLGYATDVGPISLVPQAVVGVREHADVEKAVKFAHAHDIPITARGAGSGLPGQSVGSGIVLDMRALDDMQVLGDHPQGGKIVLAQAGVICTNLNNYLKGHGVFLASYPASTDMATVGGMIANNASGANSCKLGTTQHQVLDLRVVLADGSSLWTSEIESRKEPWSGIVELVRQNKDAIARDFPRVPKNSSGYNVLDILTQLERGVPVDWTRLFAHSEGTLGIITEAKLRAVPLATQKATCIVYFTDLQQACGAIPKIYDLGTSCFDTAVTTNLDLIRETFPQLGIRPDAKVMYLIEFDDLEVKPDPRDPTRRIGQVGLMDKQAAADLIRDQVADLKELLERDYPDTAIGFEVATDPVRQDALWLGRRSALQVLYAYDPSKRPLTMIECVVLPRDEDKLLEFISYMEEVFEQEQVVAGTHGHAGDCNFHLYLLLNLSQERDRQALINVMTRITQKVADLGGSMSGEHADGRTRGKILPHVFGRDLFDLFAEMKALLDPKTVLHPGVKIIPEARDKSLRQAVEELVGIEEKASQLNLGRFQDFSYLFTGVCSICSQCADICPIFRNLSDQFAARSQAAPTFKRALALAMEIDKDLESIKGDPLFAKIYDLCLLCGQCTFKCPTDASMRDMVIRMRAEHPSRLIVPAIYNFMSHPLVYDSMISLLGLTQGVWQNRLSRRVLSGLPQGLLPTPMPSQRELPRLARASLAKRYPELAKIPPSQADVAYFYGCSSDLFAEPIADSFINIARHNDWKLSLPEQRCCGEPFASVGNVKEYHKLARYNVDQFYDYKYIVAHCPSCVLAFKEYARDFERIGDQVYAGKARAIVEKFFEPAQFIVEVVGLDNLKTPTGKFLQKVTLHRACHEKLGQKMTATKDYTRDLLNLIPGLEVVEMQGADECCGLGGPWGLVGHYELSRKMREDKINNVMASQADVVLSWCFGCTLQMRDGLVQAGSKIEAKHPLELLSQAYG
jgi:FAD/FMN-containing dehydrogenase/Fe-S oxidoreductase